MTDIRDIVWLDTETLGLHPDAPIWEFAALRREVNGGFICDTKIQMLVEHDPGDWLDTLVPQFQDDYRTRYIGATDITSEETAAKIIASYLDDAIVIGCNPTFDMERITKLLQRNSIEPNCHYHYLDSASIALGYLAGQCIPAQQPWKSDLLSKAVGVDPADFERHTAMGDVLWMVAQWDAMMPEAEDDF